MHLMNYFFFNVSSINGTDDALLFLQCKPFDCHYYVLASHFKTIYTQYEQNTKTQTEHSCHFANQIVLVGTKYAFIFDIWARVIAVLVNNNNNSNNKEKKNDFRYLTTTNNKYL